MGAERLCLLSPSTCPKASRSARPAASCRLSGVESWRQNDQNAPLTVIEADRRSKFGSLLREERREWLQAVLQDRLVHQ